jgi:hypothetical protein
MKHAGFLLGICTLFSFAYGQASQPAPARAAIHNTPVWPDTSGVHINAHGGGVLYHEGTYYWFGEARMARPRGTSGSRPTSAPRAPSAGGVVCYSSTDLYNWKNEGFILPVVDDPDSPITRGCIIERPKVIYNPSTRQFVMWLHLELRGRGYGAALTALAVGDHPTKPFKFVRALRPNAGKWPIDLPEDRRTPITSDESREILRDRSNFRAKLGEGAYTRRDFAGGQMSRDMTLFVDDDGKAYHVTSAEENYTLNIHELTDDYTDFTGKWTRVLPGGHNEAPAVVKHNGRYYILASGATGWDPNPARVLVADSIWGPYRNAGNPCVGTNPSNGLGPERTFGGQSTFILPVPGKPGKYIAMFDVWRPRNLIESHYIWLPMRFEGERMVIEWREKWDMSVFE